MRRDLNKQLCEHERVGSEMRYGDLRHAKKYRYFDEEGEDARTREGMNFRAVRSGRIKDFDENLSPLRGQVRKAIGRQWNKFYSDLCQVFDKRSVINQHILQHLQDYISTKVYVGTDDELWVHRYGSPEPLKNSSVEIYVDPRDGIIKKNRHYKSYRSYNREARARRLAKERATYRRLSDHREMRLIDGIWYVFELRDAPYGEYTYVTDSRGVKFRMFRGREVYDWLEHTKVHSEYGKPPIKYRSSKKTASKKELRDAGLK